MKEQEHLFYKLGQLALKISSLKGCVQNDFETMLEDGYVSQLPLN